MQFWQPLTFSETDQLVDAARFAEEVGFTGVMIPDHLFFAPKETTPYAGTPDGTLPVTYGGDFPDCWVTLATLAARTTSLKVMSAACILPLHNPIEVAKAAGAVTIFSNNRLLVGIGVGWKKDEFDVLGVDFHTRGRRADEWIDVLRLVWSGKPFKHHGPFFKLDAEPILPAPIKLPPIIVCGSSARALKRAACLADGWHNEANTLEELDPILGNLGRMREEAGRNHIPFEIIVTLCAEPGNLGSAFEPKLEDLTRLEQMGVTALSRHPFPSTLGRPSTLDQKKRSMERFAESIIRYKS